MINSLTIKKTLERLTGLELSVGTVRAKDPFIVVRTVGRNFFPASLREVAIARVYPGWKRTEETPASYGNIEVGSIALKAKEWFDVLATLESPDYLFVSAFEAVLAEQKTANFARAVESMLLS